MYKGKKVFAIIPARKGSKRVKRKNTRIFINKPLVAWSIECGLKSEFIDEIIISTDDQDVINLSHKYSVPKPINRPTSLCSDEASTTDVIIHVIEKLKEQDAKDFLIVLLQPTSPLRDVKDIDNAIRMIDERKLSVVSVCKAEHSPLWSNVLPDNMSMNNFIPKKIHNIRSQDLPIYYRLNGAVYVAESDYFRINNGFFGENTIAYEMPAERSIDIDTELDFTISEAIYRYYNI